MREEEGKLVGKITIYSLLVAGLYIGIHEAEEGSYSTMALHQRHGLFMACGMLFFLLGLGRSKDMSFVVLVFIFRNYKG